MRLRKLEAREWPRVQTWWGQRGDPQEHESLKPKDTAFVVVDSQDRAVGVGFLILTNADYALMEFLMTDPERTEREQALALNELVTGLIDLAKALGFKGVCGFTPIDHFSLIRHHERRGGVRASKPCWMIYKSFGGGS